MPKKASRHISIQERWLKLRLKIMAGLRQLFSRSSIANILMFSFILLCAFGAGMIYVPAGLITAGVCCGLFGFLLGSE